LALPYAGQLAALGTGVSWAIGSTFFAAAGARLGSVLLNRLRLSVAAILLMTTLLVLHGSPVPIWATHSQVMWLAVSGIIGFTLGDSFYFRALVILGPGRATVIQSLGPVFTAVLAWCFLGEKLGLRQMLGIAMTVGGVAWILAGRAQAREEHPEGSAALGIVCAVLAALGQAAGYTLSKFGLKTGLDALSATVIRVLAGTAGVWIFAVLAPAAARPLSTLRDRIAALTMVGGAVFGPFLGVLLSLVALQHTQAGVAAAIMAFYPVLTILLAARFHKERITIRMISGALVAVAGVVVLFLK
jgi:drug/metabolite transporter (DMT)-like permease